MATAHLWTSAVVLALAVPVPAGEGGTLALPESRRGQALDVSARAARSRRWRVPAAAAAVARSGEGVRRSFLSASGLGR
jgi:hypothetical protein